jgi:hypothetical protein
MPNVLAAIKAVSPAISLASYPSRLNVLIHPGTMS